MFVKVPLAFTWAFPEFDCILMMMVKEISKVIEDESCLFLEWVSVMGCFGHEQFLFSSSFIF